MAALVLMFCTLGALTSGLFAGVPPSDIALHSTSVRERQPAGTIVGILKATDADAGDAHSFAFVEGTDADDNDRFAISQHTLRTAASLDYTNKNEFRVRIRAQDGTGGSVEKPFTLTVTSPAFVNGVMDYFAANPAVFDCVRDSRVSLKALPKDGYEFDRWTSEVPAGFENVNPLVFAIDADKTIQAWFTVRPPTISIAGLLAGEALLQFLGLSNESYSVEYGMLAEKGLADELLQPPVIAGDGRWSLGINSDAWTF